MTKNGTFRGFPSETFRFLAGLASNNRKEWFEPRRGDYETYIETPAFAFIEEMALALRDVAPNVRAEPRIGGSLFRIHRDTRFARDKSPYKTHIGIRLRDGAAAQSSKCSGPLFYVEIALERLTLGVGIKTFEPQLLDAYRQAILRADKAQGLATVLAKAEGAGHRVEGELTKRVPAEIARAPIPELAKRKGVFVRFEQALPKEIHRADFVSFCFSYFVPYAPLFNWLREVALAAGERSGR